MANNFGKIWVLVVICTVSAGGLSLIYDQTLPVIEENRAMVIKLAQVEVMPAAYSFKELEFDDEKIRSVSEARDEDGTMLGYVVLAETTGFQGKISLIFGVDTEGGITRVRILESIETPGMGAKIVEDEFLRQFEGISMDTFPGVDGVTAASVDAITGATISSEAVIESVKSSLNNTMIMLEKR